MGLLRFPAARKGRCRRIGATFFRALFDQSASYPQAAKLPSMSNSRARAIRFRGLIIGISGGRGESYRTAGDGPGAQWHQDQHEGKDDERTGQADSLGDGADASRTDQHACIANSGDSRDGEAGGIAVCAPACRNSTGTVLDAPRPISRKPNSASAAVGAVKRTI